MMNSTSICRVSARQLLDCKCRPMLEVDVYTQGGACGRGSAPTGSSVGSHESFVLRDNNPAEYGGMSVHKAVDVIETVIGPALAGMDVMDLNALDKKMLELDGTPEKRILGGNSIYSTSIACARAAAASQNLPLYQLFAQQRGGLHHIPVTTFNIVNGGRFSGYTMAFNEFIVVPFGVEYIEEAVEMGVQVFHKLGEIIEHFQHGRPASTGGSYGYSAPCDDPEIVLSLMQDAIDACGYHGRMVFALDCASSEMYDKEKKTYLLKGQRLSSEELISYVQGLSQKFPLFFVEDLLDEDDWDGFICAKQKLTRTNIIGDDFIVTNRHRLEKAFELQAVDGFILKPNQVGTISEALETYDYAAQHGLIAIPSGRSGGVIGDVVMDFSVGLNAPLQKNGAPRSGERIDKLNLLLRVSSQNPDLKLCDIRTFARF